MALIDKASLLFVPSVVAQEKAFNILPSGNRAPDSTDQNSGYDQTRADFTFDRGSNAAATRVNSDGLIEKYRENLLTESNNFSDSDWNVKTGTFTQGVEDPDGGNNAWSWTATNTDPYLYQSGKSTTGVSTLSIWVKGVGSTIGASFQIRTGAAPYKNLTLTGDWQRVEHFNTNASGTSVGFEYGNPAVVGDVVHIYQAQYEVGTIATDYLDSGATTGKAGVLIDLPRINYDANGENGSLLLEPSRLNVVPYSEWFGASDWTKTNTAVTNNETTSPEGVTNASLVYPTSSSSTKWGVKIEDVKSGITNADYTNSVYLKSNGWQWVYMIDPSGFKNVWFDLQNGVVGTEEANATGDIEPMGNGWYRCTIYSHASPTTYAYMGVYFSDADNSYVCTASGTNGAYIYGFQCEAGSYATSYIPNHGESGGVTRAADSLFVESLADELTTGYTEATLYLEFKYKQESAGDAFVFGQDNGTYPAGRGYLYNKQVGFADTFGGGGFSDLTEDTTLKLIYRLNSLSNADVFLNATKGTNVSGTAWSAINQIRFRGTYCRFEISEITMFNEALTDAECITLTTL